MAFIVFFFILEKALFFYFRLLPGLEYDQRLEKLVKGEINSDLIIIGSSRGARNIIAKQIQDSLGIPAYNLSYFGSGIEFHEFILKTLLRYNKTPKTILLTLDDPKQFQVSDLNFRSDPLSPLIRYENITGELIAQGQLPKLSKYIFALRLKRNNMSFTQKTETKVFSQMERGSAPTPFQDQRYKITYTDTVDLYDPSIELSGKRESFTNFQALCVQNNIKLLLIVSPNLHPRNQSFEARVKEFLLPQTLFYGYDTLNPVYKNPDYFSDSYHLRTNGATTFTNELIQILK